MSTMRSPSKQSLPKMRAVPQNRCYRTHRKGGAVTERARREYVPALQARYTAATKRRRARHPRRLAAPLTAIRAQVPLRTWSEWTDATPGFDDQRLASEVRFCASKSSRPTARKHHADKDAPTTRYVT